MKRVRLVIFVGCILNVFNAFSQEAYKGKLFITQKEVKVDRDRLVLNLDIDCERLSLSANETLELTPILKSGRRELKFPTILLNGSEKQHSYERRKFFGNKNDFAYIGQVIKNINRKYVFHNINYSRSIPYTEWMKNAVLLLRINEGERRGKKGNIYEEKISDGIYYPEKRQAMQDKAVNNEYLPMINFIQPSLEHNNRTTVIKDVIPFSREGFINIDGLLEDTQYTVIYRLLRDRINKELSIKGNQLAGLKVTGYGSPQGNYTENEKDAATRSYSLRTYLNDNRVANNSPLEVAWVAEDWKSIRDIVSKDDMQFKNAVMDIINQVPENLGRERYLRDLAGGSPYKYLREKVFPQVRRIEYEITFYQVDPTLMTNKQLNDATGQKLDQSAFYMIANSYPQGSEEFNDLIDLTARLYPDSPEANINAAAVAISKKDVKKARHYLEKYETYAPAYNNWGILYLLEGNKDKAEIYLKLAKERGVTQAEKALRYMHEN